MSPPLSPQQRRAARLLVEGRKGYLAIAREVGVDDRTLYTWRQREDFQALVKEMENDIHEGIVNAERRAAEEGSRARIFAIKKLRKALTAAEDPKDIAALTRALDQLTTSAEDRAGHPRSEKHEVEHKGTLTTGPADVDSLVREIQADLRTLTTPDDPDALDD